MANTHPSADEMAATITDYLSRFRVGFEGMPDGGDARVALARDTLEDAIRSWVAFCALFGRTMGAFDTSSMKGVIDTFLDKQRKGGE